MSEPTTTERLLKQWLTDDATSEETARTLIKQAFVLDAVDGLFHARHNAGLTPEQMAERMETTEAAILFMEKDASLMPLSRYAEVALAYGMAPVLTLVPIEEARQQMMARLQEEDAK